MERNCYVTITKYKKLHHICTKIKSKKNDTKILYRHVNHLAGNEIQNRLPDCKSDKDLANRFANFFIKNRQNKSQVQQHTTPQTTNREDKSRLVTFAKIMETETHSIINRM